MRGFLFSSRLIHFRNDVGLSLFFSSRRYKLDSDLFLKGWVAYVHIIFFQFNAELSISLFWPGGLGFVQVGIASAHWFDLLYLIGEHSNRLESCWPKTTSARLLQITSQHH